MTTDDYRVNRVLLTTHRREAIFQQCLMRFVHHIAVSGGSRTHRMRVNFLDVISHDNVL